MCWRHTWKRVRSVSSLEWGELHWKCGQEWSVQLWAWTVLETRNLTCWWLVVGISWHACRDDPVRTRHDKFEFQKGWRPGFFILVFRVGSYKFVIVTCVARLCAIFHVYEEKLLWEAAFRKNNYSSVFYFCRAKAPSAWRMWLAEISQFTFPHIPYLCDLLF